MKRVKSSYLLIVVLLGIVLWVWFTEIDIFTKRYDIEKEALKTLTQMVIPVVIEEVKPPTKVEKELVKNNKTFKKMETGKNKDYSKGSFEPNLFARYEVPVNEYLEYMTSRGAKVLVYDKLTGRFVCEILNNGFLMKSSETERVSNHLRRLTDDFPQGKEILTMVDKHFGSGNHEILLSVPDHLHESFISNIHSIITEKGLDMKDIATVFMTYKGSSSILFVYIEKVSGSFGIRQVGEYFRL